MIRFQRSDTEIKEILETLVIVMDTREKESLHVVSYLEKKKIPVKTQTMKTGDYTAYIPKNEKYGIHRNVYLGGCIERKNSVDELAESVKDRSRFENELIRGSKNPFVLVVEDANGYEKIIKGQYRSQYTAVALLASLKTFEVRYGFTTVFLDKTVTGNYLYYHFLYTAREYLKNGLL